MNFFWKMRVYWEDTDAGGIVFYANYLKFFERARSEWLRSLGFSQTALRQELGVIFVVSATSVRYAKPAFLDDELSITAALENSKRASLHFVQTALRGGALLCESQITVACVNAVSLKPTRIPLAIYERLNPPQ
jgi:acyl-CoA thioester hydrolase